MKMATPRSSIAGFFARLGLALGLAATSAFGAETVNVYSIWPENWARPMFEEFEKATGIKVNFIRFSSGEALARVMAEKNNPRVDVLFGGPVETFAAGVKEGLFEPYKPPTFNAMPERFREANGHWIAIADDPLVFMTNNKFLADNKLQPPASWNDLLNPAYKNMLQMADARTSGTAVTRIFSVLEVNGRDEAKAFDYMKRLRPNVQLYTKSGGGGTLPVGLGQAGGGIFFIVDALDTKAKGYDVTISFPKEGIGTAGRGDRAHQGREESRAREEADRLGGLACDAVQVRHAQDQLRAFASGRGGGGEPGGGVEAREDIPDRCGVFGGQPQARRRSLDRRDPEPLT
jgi:iron(III) transport system substrate-binding protein